MARSRQRREEKTQEQNPSTPKTKAPGYWPFHVFGGLILALILATTMFIERARTGDVGIGG